MALSMRKVTHVISGSDVNFIFLPLYICYDFVRKKTVQMVQDHNETISELVVLKNVIFHTRLIFGGVACHKIAITQNLYIGRWEPQYIFAGCFSKKNILDKSDRVMNSSFSGSMLKIMAKVISKSTRNFQTGTIRNFHFLYQKQKKQKILR